MDALDSYDDISFVGQDEYSIMGIYECCRVLFDLLDERYPIGASILERCREVQSKLQKANSELERLAVED